MFSNRLRQLRKQHKISQDSLAKQLFVSQQSVAKWESGKITPNPETLANIANIFNVSADYLLGLSENEKSPTLKEWETLTDLQKQIIALMSKMTEQQQDELVHLAEYQIWRASQKKSPK